jgi:hypothetical protein
VLRAANSPGKERVDHWSAATAGVATKRPRIDDLTREAQYRLAAYDTFASAKIQQRGRVAPSRLGYRVMQVGTREADIRQDVVVKTGQQLDIAPMLPNDHQRFDPTHDARAPNRLRPRLSHGHRGALQLESLPLSTADVPCGWPLRAAF